MKKKLYSVTYYGFYLSFQTSQHEQVNVVPVVHWEHHIFNSLSACLFTPYSKIGANRFT